MMKNSDLTAAPWRGYELLDSGNSRKLERYGDYILIRPETQALWEPARPELWKKADAEFLWTDGKGSWRKKNMPDTWQLAWEDIRCTIRLTSFKHTGIFPEQAPNWEWIHERVGKLNAPKVLNLFGYTGIASIVAAKNGGASMPQRSFSSRSLANASEVMNDDEGVLGEYSEEELKKPQPHSQDWSRKGTLAACSVTHVDASKQSNAWAKENAALSGVNEGGVRYITDDALKFVEREARRGAIYDGIILDPPAFGRGAKGEVWRIEESLAPLLRALAKIFAQKPGAFFLLNGYAAGYSPQSFLQAVESFFPQPNGEFGELNIQESKSERLVPSGIYVRFTS